MDASRLQGRFGVLGQIGCSFISGLLCRSNLLALMESTDPRLISFKDSKSKKPYRLGGSRSDLFAITLFRTFATFTACRSFLSMWFVYVPALYGLTHKPFLVRPFMGQQGPDRARHLVGQGHDRDIQRSALA